MTFTEAQRQALIVLPKFTGFASAFCSAIICFCVLRDPLKRQRPHYRFLAGISAVDMCTSTWHCMSSWPMPTSSTTPWAAGTVNSCRVQGFFLQYGITNCWYNGMLALYYVLILRYGWTQAQICKFEPWMHLLPSTWGLSTAIAGLFLNLYHPSGFWCWIAPDPDHSNESDFYRWAFYYIPLWIAVLFVTACMALVYQNVRVRSRALPPRSDVYANRSSIQSGVSSNNDDCARRSEFADGSIQEIAEEEEEEEEDVVLGETEKDLEPKDKPLETAQNQSKQTITDRIHGYVRRDMALQCALYTASFYVTWIWLTIVRIQQARERSVSFGLLAVAAFMFPLQGFWNFWALILPRYLAARWTKPETSRVACMQEALSWLRPSKTETRTAPTASTH